MQWCKLLDGLDLNHDQPVHQQVDPKCVWNFTLFENNGDSFFALHCSAARNQLAFKRLTIRRFKQPRPQYAMNFDGCPDDSA